MKKVASFLRRMFRRALVLPETFKNCIRFRVFFILPRWFKMPTSIHVARRTVHLRFTHEEGVDDDFMGCFIRNDYGLGRKLREVRTILDVGANIGFFSLAARGHYPSAVIHAYEPNPRIQTDLCANTFGLDIKVFPEAVGNKDCFVTMIDTGPSYEARTQFIEGSARGIPQISFRTAIDRIGNSVDLLKLDCEGAEWEILALEGCWKSVRNIRMEYHLQNGETVDSVIETLLRNGFRLLQLKKAGEAQGIIWAAHIE
jgi:FkbM family methyltransferase